MLKIKFVFFLLPVYVTLAQNQNFEKDIQNCRSLLYTIIVNSDSIDYIKKYLLESKITFARGVLESRTIEYARSLCNYLSKNRFIDGYIIGEDTSSEGNWNGDRYLYYTIKIISIATNDTIQFDFSKKDKENWILYDYKYCLYCYQQRNKEEFKLSLQRNYEVVRNIIEKSKYIDTLTKYLLNANVVTWNLYGDYNTIYNDINRLFEQIIKNNFQNGYIIDKDTLKYINIYNGVELLYYIRIRSESTRDIIWFVFRNYQGGIWKLNGFYFCNNPEQQLPDLGYPCDKK